MRRALLGALVVLAALVGAAPPAGAQTTTAIDQAVAAFRKGESVFVHPQAELRSRLKSEDLAEMRRRIKDGDRVVFVAVLPTSAVDEAGGSADALPNVVHRRLGFAGTYAVLAGASFRAGSYEPQPLSAKHMADAAFREHRDDGPSAVLVDFVKRAEAGSGGTSTTTVLVLVLGVAAVAVVLVLILRQRRRLAAPDVPGESDAPDELEPPAEPT